MKLEIFAPQYENKLSGPSGSEASPRAAESELGSDGDCAALSPASGASALKFFSSFAIESLLSRLFQPSEKQPRSPARPVGDRAVAWAAPAGYSRLLAHPAVSYGVVPTFPLAAGSAVYHYGLPDPLLLEAPKGKALSSRDPHQTTFPARPSSFSSAQLSSAQLHTLSVSPLYCPLRLPSSLQQVAATHPNTYRPYYTSESLSV